MKYYRIISTIHHKTKVEFTSKIEEFNGIKPRNDHFSGKVKTTYYNYFDTLQQAEHFQNVNVNAKQLKGQLSMFDLLQSRQGK